MPVAVAPPDLIPPEFYPGEVTAVSPVPVPGEVTKVAPVPGSKRGRQHTVSAVPGPAEAAFMP